MKKIVFSIITVLMLVIALVGCGPKDNKTVNVEDNEGKDSVKTEESREEDVEEAQEEEKSKDIPNRTVAGTVAVLEMLDYLEVEMIAIPETRSKLDDKFKEMPTIGKPMTPDMELLKSVDPDMFISVTSLEESLKEKVEQNNIKTLFLDNSSYSTILESMEILGDLYGKEDMSNKYVEDIKNKANQIKEKIKGKEKPRVMILFGSPKSIMFATEKSFVGSLVEEMGAINVVHELDDFEDNYVPVSMEHVLGLKPDIILRLTHVKPEESRKMFDDEFAKSDVWSKLDAVKEGKVYDLDNEYFGVSGNIRILEALQSLEEILYE